LSILEEKKIRFKVLNANRAFHSKLMLPAVDPFLETLGKITFRRPSVLFLSTCTGNFEDASLASYDYWIQQLLQPVLFTKSVQTLRTFLSSSTQRWVFIEMSSTEVITPLIKSNLFETDLATFLPPFCHNAFNSRYTPKWKMLDLYFACAAWQVGLPVKLSQVSCFQKINQLGYFISIPSEHFNLRHCGVEQVRNLLRFNDSAISFQSSCSPSLSCFENLTSDSELNQRIQKNIINVPNAILSVTHYSNHSSKCSLTTNISFCSTCNLSVEDYPLSVGCISGLLTIALFAKMCDLQIISLNTPLESILPSEVTVPQFNGSQILLSHLASHTSGLPCYPASFDVNSTLAWIYFDVDYLFSSLANIQLTFSPGSQCLYSNMGMALLAQALCHVSNQSYSQLLMKYIIEPYELVGIFYQQPNATGIHTCPFSHYDNNGNRVGWWECGSGLISADGLHITPSGCGQIFKIFFNHEGIGKLLRRYCAWNREGRRCWYMGRTNCSSSCLMFDPISEQGIFIQWNCNIDAVTLLQFTEHKMDVYAREPTLITPSLFTLWSEGTVTADFFDHDIKESIPVKPKPIFPKLKHQPSSYNSILSTIVTEVAMIAGISQETIPSDSSFSECGLESLQMIVLADHLEKRLQVSVPFNQLFKYDSPSKLTNYLLHAQPLQQPISKITPATPQKENQNDNVFVMRYLEHRRNQFPFVFRATSETGRDLNDLMKAIDSQKHNLMDKLRSIGAILFRGFNVTETTDLKRILSKIFPQQSLLPYHDGISPRIHISDNVFTSTEYPSKYDMSLHNELSYGKNMPTHIAFLCQVEPNPGCGGQTPIGDSRRIAKMMDDRVIKLFREKGVRYYTLLPKIGAGLSWETTFQTTSKAEIEKMLTDDCVEWEWLPSGDLRTIKNGPGLRVHPDTGEEVWSNHAHLFHPTDLPNNVHNALLRYHTNALPKYATFGDGEEIPVPVLEHVRSVLNKERVFFDWREGDILLLDNLLISHGRMAFDGPRKIVVAMV
jgi:acyl carrier protein